MCMLRVWGGEGHVMMWVYSVHTAEDAGEEWVTASTEHLTVTCIAVVYLKAYHPLNEFVALTSTVETQIRLGSPCIFLACPLFPR